MIFLNQQRKFASRVSTSALTDKGEKSFLEKYRRYRHTPMGDLVFVAVMVILGILLALWTIGVIGDVMGIMRTEKDVEVTIVSGWTTPRMAQEMQHAGAIEHPWVFSTYSIIKNADGTYKAGTYLLNTKMTYDQMIAELQRKQSSQTVRLTFPEGTTVTQIAKILEDNKVCAKSDFLARLNTGTFNYAFLPTGEQNSNRFYRLEGYIFPDTYDFYINENVDSVINRFLNNFNIKFTQNLRDRAEEMGMTIDQVITLASIIQKEATNVYEMANVSSVFHNRLAKPGQYPKLESDVTVYYVNNDIYKALQIKEERFADAYNTYKKAGLPVGAICNPGGAAITAALNPSSTLYYYFVTDKDGGYYYASTLAQHNANIKKASKVGGIGGTFTHD